MGLLDDAIREHLDLKRRRGADPTEVERAEKEALGPVRRGPTEVDDGVEEAYDHEGEAEWDEPFPEEVEYEDHGAVSELEEPPVRGLQPVGEAPPVDDVLPVAAEPHSPEPAAVTGSVDPEEPFAADEPFDEAPEPAAPPPEPDPASPAPERRPGDAHEETVEYDVKDALEHEPPKDGEDVLEETPEFLQDTPDHDRLWFEQKPPRDFNFNE